MLESELCAPPELYIFGAVKVPEMNVSARVDIWGYPGFRVTLPSRGDIAF